MAVAFYNMVNILYQLDVLTYDEFRKIRCLIIRGISLFFIFQISNVAVINYCGLTSNILVGDPILIKLRGPITREYDFLTHYCALVGFAYLLLGVLKHITFAE